MLTDSLLRKVSPNFGGHKISTVRNLLIVCCSMLVRETACLNKLKGTVGIVLNKPETESNSHYKRLTRFFSDHAFSSLWVELLQYATQAFDELSEYLIIDGTSWKWRGKWHHYLTIGITVYGVCIPIYWVDLRKQGISSLKERKKLIRAVLRFFDLAGKIVLCDREYIGISWFKFLIDNDLSFVIRLRAKAYKSFIDECDGLNYDKLIAKVRRSKIPHKTLKKAFWIEGEQYYFIISKNPDINAKEDILLLITNLDEPKEITAARYGIRWKIEHCFKNLKSNGFDLECMNVKGDARRNLLMAVVVFAYVLSIAEGIKTYASTRVITFKNERKQKAESLFRYGIERLRPKVAILKGLLDFLVVNLIVPDLTCIRPKTVFV